MGIGSLKKLELSILPLPGHLGFYKPPAGQVSPEAKPGSFVPPPVGSMRGFFFFHIHYKDLVDLLEMKITKTWGLAVAGSPYIF